MTATPHARSEPSTPIETDSTESQPLNRGGPTPKTAGLPSHPAPEVSPPPGISM